MLTFIPKKQIPPYDDFYEKNYPGVLRYVCNKIGNREDAEDLVSDAFLYCYTHYSEYDPEKSSITTWLYLVVNSRVKNYYRDHVTHADYEEISDVLRDESIDLDAGIYLEQLHEALMKAIRTLPQRQQDIIIMRYFRNCSGEEIANTLGITPGNVRVLLSRALNKLETLYDDNWKEFINNG